MKTIFGQKCVIYDNRNSKLLILKRSNYKGDGGLWDMVGGSVDFGEDSKDSIIRETYEETKLKITNPKIIDLHSRLLEENVFFIFGLYLWDGYQGEDIKLSSEHVDYKWINLYELNEYPLRNSTKKVKDIIINYFD